jgi:CRISPR-associated protein Csm3
MANKFLGNIVIKGEIKVLTGLRIGTSKDNAGPGELDNKVIKSPDGRPYLPGTALKGVLRSALGKKEGSENAENDSASIKKIFGINKIGKGNDAKPAIAARLIIKDALLAGEVGELEHKYEVSVTRSTGIVEGSNREGERVPPGTVFKFRWTLEKFESEDWPNMLGMLVEAMNMVAPKGIGAKTNAGYGQICFENVKLYDQKIEDINKPKDQNSWTSDTNLKTLVKSEKCESSEDYAAMLWKPNA